MWIIPQPALANICNFTIAVYNIYNTSEIYPYFGRKTEGKRNKAKVGLNVVDLVVHPAMMMVGNEYIY